jgi:hypothetical protein
MIWAWESEDELTAVTFIVNVAPAPTVAGDGEKDDIVMGLVMYAARLPEPLPELL